MRLKLNLTWDQRDDLSSRGLELIPSGLVWKISKVEFIKDENYNNVTWKGLFILHFLSHWEHDPVTIPAGSPYYSILLEWFKPRVRDWKLEELGI